MRIKIVFFLIAFVNVGCSTTQLEHTNLMCNQIAHFANSAVDYDLHSVELITDWSAFSKTCNHNSYEQGKVLCDWLMKNTSTEFASKNINRALSCLNNSRLLNSNNILDYATGKIGSYEAFYVTNGAFVEIEYSVGLAHQLPKLKISIQKEVEQ